MEIRIATRKSPLALWQAEHVQQRLLEAHPGLNVKIIGMTTQGDETLDTPLYEVGGKGLFTKELEQAMLDNKADIAVHSMKDVTVDFQPGLNLAVICERDDPRDAFVSNEFESLKKMPADSVIGTSSLRRQAQISALFPKLQIKVLRGNVGTRLKKLDAGEYDALILAVSGLKRLGLDDRITEILDPKQCLPAIGQGALGIECRNDDREIIDIISCLEHSLSRTCINAERAINESLSGGCHVPIAAYATIEKELLFVQGLVGKPDGSEILRASITGNAADAIDLGKKVASDLRHQGADKILSELR